MADEPTNENEQNQPEAAAAPGTEPVAEAPKPPEITTAAAWRRHGRGKWRVYLPSGTIVKARRVDGTELLADGVMNLDELMEAITRTAKNADEDPGARFARLATAARRACSRIVVEPRVCIPNGEGELGEDVMSSEDIPATDALSLFSWSMNPTGQTLPAEPLD